MLALLKRASFLTTFYGTHIIPKFKKVHHKKTEQFPGFCKNKKNNRQPFYLENQIWNPTPKKSKNDPSQKLMTEIQMVQNNLARFLNNTKLKNKVRTKNIINAQNLLSIK